MIRTPDQRLRVFISSTLQELADERVAARAAIEQLHLVPVMFELGARPHPPSDLYRAYLRQSHVFLGLYWERYGWVAPDMEISGLEDEWVLAAEHPKLVYIKHTDRGREPRLDELIDRIRSDNSTSYRSFTTTDELRELIENDLAVLLSERFESGADDEAVVSESRPFGASQLPNPPSPIIGRELELHTVQDLVASSGTRMVTITGPGGSGKTRLAVELAINLRDEGWHRVVFADLTGLRSSSLVLPTIAARLGVKDAGDRGLVDAIASVMQGERALVVVDNFEHVIDAATDLADLLAATSGITLLVTSRQALRLRWEQEFPLHPLAVPDPSLQQSVDSVATSPAVELLVERVRRVRPAFTLTPANVAAVAEIARRLDGLPLALELAAARLRVLQPAELLDRLLHRLDALGGSSPDLPVRQQTLRATIEWSHDHLTDDERRVFRRMGVFAGGASLAAVEAICADVSGDVVELVESLVDKSLIVSTEASAPGSTDGGTRFAMLETIREFAVERLVEAREAEATWDLHLTWHTDLAERAWLGFWTSDMQIWLSKLEQEHDNVRGALDHAVGAGDAVRGLRLASALWPYWDVRGQYREGERRLQALLDAAPSEASAERGRALNARGWLLALMGHFEEADELMGEGLEMVRRLGTDHQLAWALAERGNVSFTLGHADRTGELFGECLEIARRIEDTFLIGMGLFGLAYHAFLTGDLEAMARRLDESLVLSRLVFQPWGIAWAQFSLGVLRIVQGETHRAVPPITESLELRWSIHDARGCAESIQLLATLASEHGEMQWSGLLHGSAELQREANGLTILPFLRPLHDASVARLRAALPDDEFEEVWRLGRAMPLEKLVAEALARSTGPLDPGEADGSH